MRAHAKDSAEAAARFLVLAALADGDLDRLELQVLEQFPALKQLGLDRERIEAALAEFCEDVQQRQHAGSVFALAPGEISTLLAEIEQPALQRSLCRAALGVIGVDQRIHSGEAILLWAALDAWDLQLANILRSPEARIPVFGAATH